MKKLDKMILLSLSLTLLLQSNALAEEKKIERIYGKDRYETSIKVADALSSSFEKVIVASGEMFPDALAGSVLTSGKYPIVLASKDKLEPSVRAKISKAKEVYILGGSETISSAVENDIKSLGAKVSRLSGMDRYETSVKIAQVTGSKDLILVNGDLFPDSLTASGIALLNNRSILLVKSNEIPQSVKDYIKKINPSSITIIGGNKSVDDSLEKDSKLFTSNVKRISGRDRYETSLEVAKHFTNLKNLVVASGDNFTDALSASSIAGKLKAPMLLVDGKKGTATIDYIEKNKKNIDNIKVIGGPNTVSDSTFKSISNVVETKDSKKEEDKKVLGTVIKPNKEKPNPEKPNPEKPQLADKPADGVWYGTVLEGYGTGQNGSSIVKVEIENGKVKSAEPVKHSGTGRDYILRSMEIFRSLKGKVYSEFKSIIAELSNDDLKNRGQYADTVSTATRTARGYVMATEKAIERAKKFAADKKEHKVNYIKITGESEFDPGKDRISIQSKSKLKNNTAADFDFVRFDIGLSNGDVKKNVKFTELKDYGITSNYNQGDIIKTDKDHINLEVTDESGYAFENIRLSVMPAVEKQIVRPSHILVTFKDENGTKTQEIKILQGQLQYEFSTNRKIEKVELFKDNSNIAKGSWRENQGYYVFDNFKYELGENELWDLTTYRLSLKNVNVPGNEKPEEEKPKVDDSNIKDFVPAKIDVKDKNSGKVIKTIEVNQNEWKGRYSVSKLDIEISKKYEGWTVDTFDVDVYNKENQKLNPSKEKLYGLFTIGVLAPNEDSPRRVNIKWKFVDVKDEESVINDFVPFKIVVKDKTDGKEVKTIEVGQDEWNGRYSVSKLDIEIPSKYKDWTENTFDVDVFNKSNQKLEPSKEKLYGLFTVGVLAPKEDSPRRVNIKWKFVDSKVDNGQSDNSVEKEYTGEAIAKQPDGQNWMGEESYMIKVKVTVKDGRIVKVEDDGTKAKPLNEGFFNLSKAIFEKYKGKDIASVKEKEMKDIDIDVVSTATVSSNSIHEAIKNALKDAK